MIPRPDPIAPHRSGSGLLPGINIDQDASRTNA